MENEDLMQGIAAAKAGKLQEAQGYLMGFVRANPTSEEGWLWLGHCLSDPKKREYCYQKTLSINPNNQTARRALLALVPPALVPPAPVSREVSPPPAQTNVSPPLSPRHDLQPQATPKPLSAPRPRAKTRPKRPNPTLLIGLGFVVMLLLCAIPLGILFLTGSLNTQMAQLFPAPASPTPLPSATQTPLPSLTPTPIPPTPTPTPNATIAARNNQVRADAFRSEALSLMNQGQFEQAIAAWDKVINLVQDNDVDYVQRATSEYSLTLLPISLKDIQHFLELAVADMDRAIALNPDQIEYYGMRHQTLAHLGDMQELTVNRLYLYELAGKDLQVVLTRAPGKDAEADDKLATLLVYSGRCDEGLAKLKDLIPQALPQQKARFYFLQSVGYACLGKLTEAIKAIDLSEANGGGTGAMALRHEYLYQAGKSQEALAAINKFIDEVPGYGGERYYLRALIYYEMGNTAQAEQDLTTGQELAYTKGQVLAYLQGKLALDKGNKEEAIKYLQLSEASLDVIYNVLRWRIQKELLELGAEPLQMTPTVLLTRTPTP